MAWYHDRDLCILYRLTFLTQFVLLSSTNILATNSPLAKKLKDCGVFGVSSDEYLNYALENRREWEKKGKAIVEANHEKIFSAMEASHRSYAELDADIAEPVGLPKGTYNAEEVEETEYSLSEEPLRD